jgi:hypothetical protein
VKQGIVWSLLGAAMVLAGCETVPQRQFPPPQDYVAFDGLRIESRFPSVELTRENVAAEATRCIPQLEGTGAGIKQLTSKLPLPPGTSTLLGHVSSASQFMVSRSTGICLQQSQARHTILAAEAFVDTVSPVGIPPDVLDDWYKQIALKMAQAGAVKVAYVYTNGNAVAVSYWFGSGETEKRTLYYSQEFKKAGAWEAGSYGLVFKHANLASISETKRNGVGRKSDFISQRG